MNNTQAIVNKRKHIDERIDRLLCIALTSSDPLEAISRLDNMIRELAEKYISEG